MSEDADRLVVQRALEADDLEAKLREMVQDRQRLVADRDAWNTRAEHAEDALDRALTSQAGWHYALRCDTPGCSGIIEVRTDVAPSGAVQHDFVPVLGWLAVRLGWTLSVQTAHKLAEHHNDSQLDRCPACTAAAKAAT